MIYYYGLWFISYIQDCLEQQTCFFFIVTKGHVEKLLSSSLTQWVEEARRRWRSDGGLEKKEEKEEEVWWEIGEALFTVEPRNPGRRVSPQRLVHICSNLRKSINVNILQLNLSPKKGCLQLFVQLHFCWGALAKLSGTLHFAPLRWHLSLFVKSLSTFHNFTKTS